MKINAQNPGRHKQCNPTCIQEQHLASCLNLIKFRRDVEIPKESKNSQQQSLEKIVDGKKLEERREMRKIFYSRVKPSSSLVHYLYLFFLFSSKSKVNRPLTQPTHALPFISLYFSMSKKTFNGRH